eukprot:gnl/TRDRNA2_/TRDRNA2_184431_c0_seq1.p1 gnl/TRDRNA2_/TRDRNA2_184431_c0~~gnl/TRDRNA2_/TRDRNA2_184431_c0_seq1.p1  ORF type:complete len:438 (+),score=102.86 gnl/TRDRNA2_/TRDRNA2_184431_c0_seq1:106-1419(+)
MAFEHTISAFRRCFSKFVKPMPPEPVEQVKSLLRQLRLKPKHVAQIYQVFLQLKEHDPLTVTSGPDEVSTDSVKRLVEKRREYMEPIFRNLLDLGGYRQILNWDGFLYIFLKLCTLSKIELCQVMFFIIAKEVKSWSVHYLTSTQLQEFYDLYDKCPVTSFNTAIIDFSTMEHAKFSMMDFVQLVHSYTQLINPMLYFQRCLQQSLPSAEFWSDYDHVQVSNRKITLDFFIYAQGMFSSALLAEVLVKRMAQEDMQQGGPKKEQQIVEQAVSGIQLPLPCGVLPPPRRRRREEVEVPLWLQQMCRTNEDPVKGVPLGTGAQPLVPQIGQKGPSAQWPPKPGQTIEAKTVEEASAGIKQSFGMGSVELEKVLYQQRRSKALRESLTTKVQGHIRSQELEFIKRSRESINQHDNIVTILERSCQFELLKRPEKLVMGHT